MIGPLLPVATGSFKAEEAVALAVPLSLLLERGLFSGDLLTTLEDDDGGAGEGHVGDFRVWGPGQVSVTSGSSVSRFRNVSCPVLPGVTVISPPASISSVKTVRRWIKAGKFRADIRDGAYLVAPDDVSALVGRMSAPGAGMPAEGVHPSEPVGADTGLPQTDDPLLTIIRELQAELLQTTAAAAMWQERARMLSDQFALAAPQSPPGDPGAPQPLEPAPGAIPGAVRTWAPWLLAVLAVVAAVGLLGAPVVR